MLFTSIQSVLTGERDSDRVTLNNNKKSIHYEGFVGVGSCKNGGQNFAQQFTGSI